MRLSIKSSILLAVPVLSISMAWAAPQNPEAVYQRACRICHDSGVAGAPKKGETAVWASRLELGMEALIASVKNGKGAMPPKAMCMDCSDEDYQAVITYMSSPN